MIACPDYYRPTAPSNYGYNSGCFYISTTRTETYNGPWTYGTNYPVFWTSEAPEPEETPEDRLAQKRAISRASLARARLALQRALDDPRLDIPVADRKRPYARPRTKKRVCAGSSRYRVLVN